MVFADEGYEEEGDDENENGRESTPNMIVNEKGDLEYQGTKEEIQAAVDAEWIWCALLSSCFSSCFALGPSETLFPPLSLALSATEKIQTI